MTQTLPEPALAVHGLSVTFGHGRRAARVLNSCTLSVLAGRTLGLVGESGSGKSTLAKAIIGTVEPSSGAVHLEGVDVSSLSTQERLRFRRRVQLIPQDPYSSLNPRRTVGQTMAESLDPHHADVRSHRDVMAHWLELVRLPADSIDRYPHEFSGGQRQRIAIARALIIEPEVVIADEITSALDVSVQAEILALLARLRRELALTMLFISHNLAVVRQVSDDVVVLFRGNVVEQGECDAVFDSPQHEYTRALLDAVPGSGYRGSSDAG